MYTVGFERSSLLDLVPRDCFLPMNLARGSVLAEPARSFFASMHQHALGATALGAYAGERIAHEMLASLVLETSGFSGTLNGVSESLRERAIAFIASSKNDPDLSVTEIARALSISVRHLQRIFQEAGSTVSAEIRRQRVWEAHMILNQQKYDVLTVVQIAERTGFRTVRELRRAHVQYFGVTPREVRKQR